MAMKTTDYEDIMDALKNYPKDLRSDQTNEFETEQAIDDNGSFSRADITLGYRQFGKRTVWRGVLKEVPYVSDQG